MRNCLLTAFGLLFFFCATAGADDVLWFGKIGSSPAAEGDFPAELQDWRADAEKMLGGRAGEVLTKKRKIHNGLEGKIELGGSPGARLFFVIKDREQAAYAVTASLEIGEARAVDTDLLLARNQPVFFWIQGVSGFAPQLFFLMVR